MSSARLILFFSSVYNLRDFRPDSKFPIHNLEIFWNSYILKCLEQNLIFWIFNKLEIYLKASLHLNTLNKFQYIDISWTNRLQYIEYREQTPTYWDIVNRLQYIEISWTASNILKYREQTPIYWNILNRLQYIEISWTAS